MRDAQKHKFDVVAVWKFDRFARSTRELVFALEQFQNWGIDFLSVTQSVDTSGPMGRLVICDFINLDYRNRLIQVLTEVPPRS